MIERVSSVQIMVPPSRLPVQTGGFVVHGSTRGVSADVNDSPGEAAVGAINMNVLGMDVELGLFEVVVRGSSDLTAGSDSGLRSQEQQF